MVLVTVDQTQSRCLSPLLLPSARASSETSRPRPLTAPQPALSFFPPPFCPPHSQEFSLRAQCRDLTSPGALVFPGKLEGLFLSAPSRLLSARVSRPQSQLVPGSEPVQEWGRGVAVGWRGGYSLIEGLSQQRAGFGFVSFIFPLRYNSHRMHHSKCKVPLLFT